MTSPSVHVRRYTGREVRPLIPELARLRIDVFREYPYLYEGTMAYEQQYLENYSASDESLFVVVRDDTRIVGVSTGIPLTDADEEFRAPFEQEGYDLERVYYFGESVLDPDHRGQGLGWRFFEEREAFARELGRFDVVAFCAVERAPDDPRRPDGYRPLHGFWERLGFERRPELHTTYSWQEVDEEEESPKPMVFWLKPLS